jgi:hypothetical protein
VTLPEAPQFVPPVAFAFKTQSGKCHLAHCGCHCEHVNRTGWYSFNTLDLYSGGAWFETQLEQRLISTAASGKGRDNTRLLIIQQSVVPSMA